MPKWEDEGFDSEEAYNNKVKEWEDKNPGFPGLWDAFWGRETAKIIMRVWVDRGGACNDKWLHCYIGCRIAEETNNETAEYAGWYKENRDLTDGNPRTRFDEADYDATIACLGQNCVDCCRERFGSPWIHGCEID
jgi:hypothetical protein